MTKVKWHKALRNRNTKESCINMVSEKRYGKNVPTYRKVTWAQIICRRWKKMSVAITFFLSAYVPSPFPSSSCCSGPYACSATKYSFSHLHSENQRQFKASCSSLLVHTGRIKLIICVVMELAVCPIVSKLLQFYEQVILQQWLFSSGAGWNQSVKQLYTSKHPRSNFFPVSYSGSDFLCPMLVNNVI